MRTWNDYKEHVKSVDPEIGKDMDEGEYPKVCVNLQTDVR